MVAARPDLGAAPSQETQLGAHPVDEEWMWRMPTALEGAWRGSGELSELSQVRGQVLQAWEVAQPLPKDGAVPYDRLWQSGSVRVAAEFQ